jgi:hypothetical protein
VGGVQDVDLPIISGQAQQEGGLQWRLYLVPS